MGHSQSIACQKSECNSSPFAATVLTWSSASLSLSCWFYADHARERWRLPCRVIADGRVGIEVVLLSFLLSSASGFCVHDQCALWHRCCASGNGVFSVYVQSASIMQRPLSVLLVSKMQPLLTCTKFRTCGSTGRCAPSWQVPSRAGRGALVCTSVLMLKSDVCNQKVWLPLHKPASNELYYVQYCRCLGKHKLP